MNERITAHADFGVVASRLEDIAKSADFRAMIEKSEMSDENVAVPFGGTPFKHANANDLVKKFEEIAEQMGMPVEWGRVRGERCRNII
ncbi:MAG: hypothetical protein FWH20_05115 [Oscillospiraceae bacterium]|nr:hypothetical protein [Oscillospiraceae bacterium]